MQTKNVNSCKGTNPDTYSSSQLWRLTDGYLCSTSRHGYQHKRSLKGSKHNDFSGLSIHPLMEFMEIDFQLLTFFGTQLLTFLPL